jgi:hypothetical protein
MAYNVEFKMTYNNNLPGKTFKTWVSALAYADLNGLFPEINEADWPTVKSNIIGILSSSKPTPNVTPGVANYTEVITDNDITINVTFNNIDAYNLYADYCTSTTFNDFDLRTGFAFELASQPIDPYPIELSGRTILKTIDNRTNVFPLLGPWLFAKYHITYKTARTCIHTET